MGSVTSLLEDARKRSENYEDTLDTLTRQGHLFLQSIWTWHCAMPSLTSMQKPSIYLWVWPSWGLFWQSNFWRGVQEAEHACLTSANPQKTCFLIKIRVTITKTWFQSLRKTTIDLFGPMITMKLNNVYATWRFFFFNISKFACFVWSKYIRLLVIMMLR